jgi:hypothetical protein
VSTARSVRLARCRIRGWGRRTARRLCGPGTVLTALVGVALATAAPAGAAPNAALLDWTGLADTDGVPIGSYYLALASLPDEISSAATGFSANPASWPAALLHTLAVVAGRATVAAALTGEAALFVAIVAVALWALKVTVSTYWLTVVGQIAQALTGAVLTVTTRAGLLLIAVPVGVFAGVLTCRRGEAGRGATMILIALTLPATAVAVFADPAAQMYGPDGLLAFGRRIGFSVAQAATRGAPPGGGAGSVDTLTASLITHTVREPLQLWNFGHVVDKVGGCGRAWSAAVRAGAGDGPVRAMAACGDRAAVAYAGHLDGSNAWAGLLFVGCALLLAAFMLAAGWAVLRVSVQAVWTTVILLPSLWLGAVPGVPQRRAADVVWRFFRHAIEATVYIGYVSVVGLAVQRIVTAPLPAALGGDNPVAHVLMMGATAVAALLLLRHIRADLTGHPPGRAAWSRAADVAVGMGLSAAVGATGRAAGHGARALWGRRPGAAPPWERGPQAAAESGAALLGPPVPGFDAVPVIGAAPFASGAAAADPPLPEPHGPPVQLDLPASATASAGSARARGPGPAPGGAPGAAVQAGTGPAAVADPPGPAPAVPGIVESQLHGVAVPLPPEPPPADDEVAPEPPGPPGAATTVDAITET